MDVDAPICPACDKLLPEEAAFCPHCGTKLKAFTSGAEIDAYIRGRVRQELEGHLSDKEVIVSSVADGAEDLLWKRTRRAVWLALPLFLAVLALLGYLGFKTYGDTIGKIRSLSTTAIKQIQDASKLVQAERETIAKTATEADALKRRTDQLSSDVRSQSERIRARGGEIDARIAAFDKSEADVQAKLQGELGRAAEMSKRLDAVERSLTASAVEVSHQADAVGIEKAFPGLGVPRYVLFGGNRWTASDAKKSGEKWVSFSIYPVAMPELTKPQVEEAVSAMKKLGVTPIYQGLMTAGPFYTALNLSPMGSLYYFHRQDAVLADTLSASLSKALGRQVPVQFHDPATDADKAQQLILQTTDLDFLYVVYPKG